MPGPYLDPELQAEFEEAYTELLNTPAGMYSFSKRDRNYLTGRFLTDIRYLDLPTHPNKNFKTHLRQSVGNRMENGKPFELHGVLKEKMNAVYNVLKEIQARYFRIEPGLNGLPLRRKTRIENMIKQELSTAMRVINIAEEAEGGGRKKGGCGCMVPQQGGYTSENPKSNPLLGFAQQGGYRATKKDKKYLNLYKKGKSIGFTMTASLKAKGLIPRANGTRRVSKKYRR